MNTILAATQSDKPLEVLAIFFNDWKPYKRFTVCHEISKPNFIGFHTYYLPNNENEQSQKYLSTTITGRMGNAAYYEQVNDAKKNGAHFIVGSLIPWKDIPQCLQEHINTLFTQREQELAA